jgi:hypothetical protein
LATSPPEDIMNALQQAEQFVELLQKFPTLPCVFNPWRDVDPVHDESADSPEIRALHLAHYLKERIGVADTVLIAEAPGYQGCHFSGMAMTSERILLGHQVNNGIHPTDVFENEPLRTSKREVQLKGFNEPTATIVWKAIKATGTDPRRVVLWNSFAFHPMKTTTGWLTNRKPTQAELDQARHLLEHFLSLFPKAFVVPVGRVAEDILGNLGITCSPYVRHPANGGATEFRTGMGAYWTSEPKIAKPANAPY